MKSHKGFFAILLTLVLAGCGGGHDADPIVGHWSGGTDGDRFAAVVTDQSTLWGVKELPGGIAAVKGEVWVTDNMLAGDTLQDTAGKKAQIEGKLVKDGTQGGRWTSITNGRLWVCCARDEAGNETGRVVYSYTAQRSIDKTHSPAALAGTYANGDDTLTIRADGGIAGSTAGCVVTGTASPGVGYVRAALAFEQSDACAALGLAGAKGEGIAFEALGGAFFAVDTGRSIIGMLST